MTIALDTNILCYALEPAYPEHVALEKLLLDLSPANTIALNPTVIHETYHVLVFYSEWTPDEAARRLTMLLKHPHVEFYNQTRTVTQVALNIAAKLGIDGRDALIIANYLTNKVPTLYTHDIQLLKLKKIVWKNSSLKPEDPLQK
jgi:predicted nucleic acid-binding protein